MRWNKDFFPFTEPSYELEVQFNGNWMEVLGCGVIHSQVMKNSNRNDDYGWAFGLGLERLAMILFDIPDIRLFWSEDERFSSQFKNGNVIKFIPYSKFPLCYKDVSFWLPKNDTCPESDAFHPNDVYDVSNSFFELCLFLITSSDLFYWFSFFSSFRILSLFS
jgi:phenylalanyl-tRNA synthetase alpha chain